MEHYLSMGWVLIDREKVSILRYFLMWYILELLRYFLMWYILELFPGFNWNLLLENIINKFEILNCFYIPCTNDILIQSKAKRINDNEIKGSKISKLFKKVNTIITYLNLLIVLALMVLIKWIWKIIKPLSNEKG